MRASDNGGVIRAAIISALGCATVAGVLPAAAGAASTPVVRLVLAESDQSVRINGVRAGLGGEAVANQAGRVRAALGPRDGCRVVEPPDGSPFSASRWRSTGVLLRTEPLSGEPDCDAPTESVMSIVISSPAGRVVTERGVVRVGARLPPRLRAAAGRVRTFGARSVVTWPLTEPCTGRFIPGSTALLVRVQRDRVASASIYTGVREVVTCDGS